MMFGYWGEGGGGLKLRGFVHMLKWDCACVHAQLEACICSTGSVHMLNCKRAHAQLECVHSVSVHMLTEKCAHAQLEACTCSSDFVHMLNWKRAKRAHVANPPPPQYAIELPDSMEFVHVRTFTYTPICIYICVIKQQLCW